MSFDWKGTLGSVCPFLASLIPGVGPVASIAVKKVCDACGLEATPENAQNIAQMASNGTLPPEQMVALKKAENDHLEAMQALADKAAQASTDAQLTSEQTMVDDTKDARKMAAADHDNTARNLTYFTTIGFFGLLTLLIFHAIPEASKSIVYVMIGVLGKAWGDDNHFFVGGSYSAKDAMQMLYNSNPIDPKK
jgi:hypothetical protein